MKLRDVKDPRETLQVIVFVAVPFTPFIRNEFWVNSWCWK